MDSFHLSTVSSARLVGIIIDNKLIWDEHASAVTTKVARQLGALQRARRSLSLHARKLFVVSVILPDLDYCCSVFACVQATVNDWRLLNARPFEFALMLATEMTVSHCMCPSEQHPCMSDGC